MDKPKPNKLAQFYSGQIQPNGALSLRRSVQFWSGVDSGGTQPQIAAAKTRLPPSVDIDICPASEKRPLANRIYADRSDGRF
jgi:hypothetical protein